MASFAEFTTAPASLQTWSEKVPTDLSSTAALEILREEREALDEAEATQKQAGAARARKAGSGVSPRRRELDAEIEKLEKVLEESEATLTMRVFDPGEWIQFVEEHPAAEEGEPGHTMDVTVCRGWVSASALLENIGRFIVGWNDEPLGEGAWTAAHTKKIPPANTQKLLQSIVDHHQRPVILPKSSSASSPTRSSATN